MFIVNDTSQTTQTKTSLKWNDFHPNVTKSFQRLRHEKDYSDVTLIGDDYQPLWAHKVVLSSISEYFKNVLYNSRNYSNPVLCIEGLNERDLSNVLDYIYNGELHIYQKDLEKFLMIAERLKLDGVMGQETKREDEGDNSLTQEASEHNVELPIAKNLVPAIKEPKPSVRGMNKIKSEDLSFNELNEKIDEMIFWDTSSGLYMCKFCSKTGKIGHMREHVEIHHVDGLQFPCKFCGKLYRSRATVRAHVSRDHRSLQQKKYSQ